MSEHVRTSVLDGIITVELDRQDKRNAIDGAITDAIAGAVDALAARDDLRVLVLQAVGPYFTAGIDLNGELARAMAAPSAHPGMSFRRAHRSFHQLLDELEAVEKPVVMAIQGPCLGAGLEIATSCDFRIASDAATFSLPEVRIGVTPGSGGATRLCRLVGPHWTKWLAMAGQTIDAERALQIGLVHDVVSATDLPGRVGALVADLVELPAEAMGMAKLVVDAAVDADRTTQRHLDRFANTSLFGSPEFVARTTAFSGARP